MKGKLTVWATLDDRIRHACTVPGALFKLADETGVAYSTLTARARKMGLRNKPAVRKPNDPKIKPNTFNVREKTRKAPDGPVVVPKDVKITRCPGYEDTRFKADPGAYGAGFVAQWEELRGKGL